MEATICELVAKNSLTLHQLVTCDYLRESFEKSGWILPESSNTVKQIIVDEANKAKEAIRQQIRAKLESTRFTLILDEWTSQSSNRYMSVILTDGQQNYNLGLAEIHGSATSENIQATLSEKVSEFDLSFEKHIISVVSDGASVLKKMHRNLKTETQICHAHGIHLSVNDLLLKNSPEEIDQDEENGDCTEDIIGMHFLFLFISFLLQTHVKVL